MLVVLLLALKEVALERGECVRSLRPGDAVRLAQSAFLRDVEKHSSQSGVVCMRACVCTYVCV